MGYHRHHVIVVVSWNREHLERARTKALDIFPWVSEMSPPAINGFQSFFIPPDGSKEWWTGSQKGDQRRLAYKRWLVDQDAELFVHWAESWFGENDDDTGVSRDAMVEPPWPEDVEPLDAADPGAS